MKPNLTEEEFIDWWLEKYHNTNIEQVQKDHPEWMKDPQAHSRDFYQTYACTQEQHDEWYEWAIERIMKHYRLSKKRAKRDFALSYINVAPTVKD